ncbi:hypothetical protein KUTeg_007372 [Tegillarca granosa]|uniref:Uncharacterized protein n=1 Tax=Tegillarca granosa TaxID=220873 RepID=A0ABQ9FH66_TEGGR|nr:hypothetical protein KUTeg_007372 [Tegillarca granosa]
MAFKIVSISSSVAETHKTDVHNNRNILAAIIEVLVLCGKQNIPIRDHTEERSNFLVILKSKAIIDPILMEHILLCEMDHKDKYNEKDSSDSTSCGIKDNNYEVREEILTFIHATETTGEALAQLDLSTLDSLGIKE